MQARSAMFAGRVSKPYRGVPKLLNSSGVPGVVGLYVGTPVPQQPIE